MKVAAFSTLGQRSAAPPISWLMGLALAQPRLISLAAGFTDSETLPVRETRALLTALLRSPQTGRAALQYGTTPGDPTFRQLIAQRLCRLDGPGTRQGTYSAERLLVTNGSQQLLYLVTEALCDPGDIVLVEDPTYFVYLGILQSHGVQSRGISMGPEGVTLQHLEAVLTALQRDGLLPRVKLFYMVSYFQNPTGLSTRFETKTGVLRLLRQFESAAGHPIYLLEDAAYRELRFAGPAIKSALAVPGAHDRVLYAGTYSKPFATGMRVGFGLMPEPVRTVVMRLKGNHDFGTSNLLQHILAHALASGKYDDHLERLRRRYAHKARVMARALEKHFPPSLRWRMPEGGLYFWVECPRSIRTGPRSALFRRALARNVLYVPGQFCYADDPSRRKPDHQMRLSFGGVSEERIRAGIARLGQALRTPIG